ncbi:MAG: hypothetical protein WCR30_01150 [Clostridia bacterium]
MEVWWIALSTYAKACFIIACSGTLLMLLQLILLLVGWGHDGDADLNVDDGVGSSIVDIGGLKVFTIRGAIVFLAVGGWVAFVAKDLPIWASILLGLVMGAASAVLLAYAFKIVNKLQDEGNVKAEFAVGKKATVYLTVPAANKGSGKINLIVQERLVEFTAVTESKTPFKTGEVVLVSGLNASGELIVEKIKE